jgi:hypothetical protein
MPNVMYNEVSDESEWDLPCCSRTDKVQSKHVQSDVPGVGVGETARQKGVAVREQVVGSRAPFEHMIRNVYLQPPRCQVRLGHNEVLRHPSVKSRIPETGLSENSQRTVSAIVIPEGSRPLLPAFTHP